jgi:translocation and assembly module TamB
MRSLLGSSGQAAGLFGNGRVSGRLDIGGNPMHSVNDLRGTLTATLNQTSVRELPILSAATPFLNVSGLSAPFQSGDLRGRFSNGLFQLERLALSNSSAQLFANGNVVLSTGRLNLDVVALTGNYSLSSRGLSLLASRIPALGPVPIGVIQDVSDFLSNRTIRLSVSGTVQNPIVRLNAAALLTEEAVRFVLARYVLGAAGLESIYSTGRR